MEGKKRNTNFTPDEKRILSELVLKYKDSVENKKTDAATNTQKNNAWIRLATEFNSVSTFCHRTHLSLRTCWDNIKRQSKKEKANIKKEAFKTGGGLPPQMAQDSQIDGIVEAVLGPAVEGIPNCYDSDRTTNTIIEFEVDEPNTLDLSILTDEYNSQEERPTTPYVAGVIISNEVTKENVSVKLKHSGDPEINTPTTSGYIDYSKHPPSTSNDVGSWTDWTPKTLKRPLSDCLRSNIRKEDKHMKRRRPVNENLQDQILQEKLDLVKLLKQKAEEEANIRIAILKEQLKQEQIKTEKLTK
ncbi:uncharacterized protein LOC113240553 [Hyposmocoma kahamanoa]|uniref:uncharacterized protein LOC113240553 n=1 Tax=Hyposmocoma kahamanoa TaxID=1477025 RepID=UPI000E6D6D1C|nr:uncharacterized protein LOC113240553 [Hyposmocoma kahamanoa]